MRLFRDAASTPNGFSANDTRYQVDHILPWSRFGDDSYLNKTLCCDTGQSEQTRTNAVRMVQGRQDRSGCGWLYVARVEGLKEIKGLKKRNLCLKDAASIEEKFKARNLTDTQWATRLLADELKRMFPASEGERRVFTRPGAITSKLRRAWGLEGYKKVDGKRVEDDRHHAVDAIVLAATTESLLNGLTREVQQREREGRQDDIFHMSPSHGRASGWMSSERSTAMTGCGGIFISRAERRRARGKAHDATIKQIREIDGEENRLRTQGD